MKRINTKRALQVGARGMVLAAALSLLGVVNVVSAEPPSQDVNTQAWTGQNISQVVRQLGRPTSSDPMTDTGGNLFVFAEPGKPHYVVTTRAGGWVVKAVRVQ